MHEGGAMMTEQSVQRNTRKTKVGVVVSDKMDKTCVIKVERVLRHPLYQRIVRKSEKIKVHDENNECRVGDRIKVMETRPLSRDKRWRLMEIVEKAK
jgi:small subunit ribosomal protein S17